LANTGTSGEKVRGKGVEEEIGRKGLRGNQEIATHGTKTKKEGYKGKRPQRGRGARKGCTAKAVTAWVGEKKKTKRKGKKTRSD